MKIALFAVVASSLVIAGCASVSDGDSDSSPAGSNSATLTTEQFAEPQMPEESAAADPLPLCDAIDEDAAASLGVSGPYRPLEHRTESGEIESACWSDDEGLLITAVRHQDSADRAMCVQDAVLAGGFMISPMLYPVEGGSLSIDAESGTTTGGWEVNDYCFALLLHSDPYIVAGNLVMGASEAELSDVVLPLVASSRGLVA